MNPSVDLHNKRDLAAGFASALFLHSIVLYCMCSYHVIPPSNKPLAVFVNLISLPSPAMQTKPVYSVPVQKKQSIPIKAAPFLPKTIAYKAPATSPAEQSAQLLHTATAQSIPASVSEPQSESVGPASVSIPNSNTGAVNVSQPIIRNEELSLNCQDRSAPAYPRQSTRFGEQGKTVLLVELDELGQVINVTIKVTSGFSRLDEAAVNAVKTWRCTPAKRNGIAVRSVAMQPFNFTLKGR